MVSSAYNIILVGKKSVPVRYHKSLYITKICFGSVHCIKINHKWFLSKQATVECYQGWQYGVFVFIAGWVVLFPFTLYIGVVSLRSRSLNPNDFLVTLVIPPSMIWFIVRSCLTSNVSHQHHHHQYDYEEETGSSVDVDLVSDDDNDAAMLLVVHLESDIMDAERSALVALVMNHLRSLSDALNVLQLLMTLILILKKK